MLDHINGHERRAVARIASLRLYREMTQKQLANACGMTRNAISSIESGHRSLKLGEAVAIAEALGVDLGALVSTGDLVLNVQVRID